MPFLWSTSKESGACLGAATGDFLGSGSSYVVLNRVNKVTVYAIPNGPNNEDGNLHFIQDFRLNCTLKYIHALPILNPNTNKVSRYVLFMLSLKQDVSIVAFVPSNESGSRLTMVTLFFSTLNDLYQYRPGVIDLVCTTSSEQPETTPFVAFGINRGEFFTLDILAAIGSFHARRKHTLHNIFAKEVIGLMEARASHRPFSRRAFDSAEYDVRDIAFASSSSQDALLLCVLYADAHGRTHISQYTLQKDVNETTSSLDNRPFLYLEGILDCDRRMLRKGLLISNADPSASRLVVLPGAMVLVGSQLVTLIPRTGKPHPPVSRELPSSTSELACACRVDDDGVFLSFKDGSCAYAAFPLAMRSSGQALRVTPLLYKFTTIPTDMLTLGRDWVLATSRLDSTILVNHRHNKEHLLIDNCGPVMDVSVVHEGPRSTVIASTGVGANGGLSLVRSAVTVIEDLTIPLSFGASCVFNAHRLVVVSSEEGSKLFTIETETVAISEIAFDCGAAPLRGRVLQVTYDPVARLYTMVYSEGKATVRLTNGKARVVGTVKFDMAVNFVALHGNAMAVSGGTCVTVYQPQKKVCRWEARHPVSSLAFVSSDVIAFGDWERGLSLWIISSNHLATRVTLPSISRSIAVTCHESKVRVFIGMINGCLVETTQESLMQNAPLHEIFVMSQPVECVSLPSHNGIVCLGEVPLFLLISDKGVQLTGLRVARLSDCCPLEPFTDRVLFLCRQTPSLAVAHLQGAQKTNRTLLRMGATVTHVSHLQPWGGFVASLRRAEMDEIAYVPFDLVESPWKATQQSLQGVTLLENERCVFIEPLMLGGTNESHFVDPGSDPFFDDRFVVLVGSTFTFPDEQRARSSRITWYQRRERHLVEIGSKDIVGQLQCCCPIPRYGGRIALGVSGCILVFNWSFNDKTFVSEERCAVGMTVVKLIPIYEVDVATSKNLIVALDARYSALFISVDPIQGAIECLGRDPKLRGIMDGVASSSSEVCACDDDMNFVCLHREDKTRRLRVSAQYHVGDLVTAIQPGSLTLPTMTEKGGTTSAPLMMSGITGSQMVYGTASGAFGTITPITNLAFVFLKSMEIAVCQVKAPLAGFTHDRFREPLFDGQVQQANRNLSFFAVPDPMNDAASRDVCDGDAIEQFLSLSPSQKRKALEMGQRLVLRYWSPSTPLTLRYAMVESCASLEEVGTEDVDRCNSALADAVLPQLPLDVDSVERYIHALQRIH